jgi:hypothetical protein
VRHLEPVTQRVNTLRGVAPSALCALKTECPSGHKYTPENTYLDPKGARHCRVCKIAAHERWESRLDVEGQRKLSDYRKRYRQENRETLIAYLREYHRKKMESRRDQKSYA